MRNRLFFLFLLLGIASLNTSCRKLVSKDFPPFESKPTVNALLTVGDSIRAHLSLAQAMGNQALPFVDDASVRLFEGDSLLCTLPSAGMGWYRAPIVAQAEKNYHFEIAMAGYDSLHCALQTPKRPEIRRIDFFRQAGYDDEGLPIPGLKLQLSNPVDRRLFYQLIIWIGEVSSSPNLRPATVLQIDDPVLLNEGLPILVFSNEAMADSLYSMNLRFTTNSYSSHARPYMIRIELRSIERDFYHYLKALYLYDRGRFDSFIGEVYPSFPIYSNVKNGYGLVSSMSRWVSADFISTDSGVSDDGIIHYQ